MQVVKKPDKMNAQMKVCYQMAHFSTKFLQKKKTRHTSKANLLPKDTSIKVGNIARIAPKWPQRIQGQCDGHRDVDQTRVLQQGWRLGAGSRLATGHCALWCNGLIQAVLEGLVF